MSFWDDLLGKTAAKGQIKGSKVAAKDISNGISRVDESVNKATGYLDPYAKSGSGANNLLSDALGINGPEAQARYYAQFQTDPGYQSALNAGLDAVGQGQTFAGNYRSGATLKGLQDYGQRQMWGQYQDRLNALTGVSNQGQSAATQQGQFTTTGAIKESDLLAQRGEVLGGGIVGAANAKSASAQNIFNAGAGLLGAGLGGLPGGARNYLSAATGGSGGWQTSITP